VARNRVDEIKVGLARIGWLEGGFVPKGQRNRAIAEVFGNVVGRLE